MKNGIELREADLTDAHVLFMWRNLPSFVPLTTSQREVDWIEHWQWLEHVLEKDAADHIVWIITKYDHPIGTIRVDGLRGSSAVISIHISPVYAGRGHGPNVLEEACQRAFGVNRKLKRIAAFIRTDNTWSIRAFEKAGFVRLEEPTAPDHHVTYIRERTMQCSPSA